MVATSFSCASQKPKQSIYEQLAWRRRITQESTTAGHNSNILFAILALKGDRYRLPGGTKLRLPKFLAGFGVKGAELVINRGAEEDLGADVGGIPLAAFEVVRPGTQETVGATGSWKKSARPSDQISNVYLFAHSLPARNLLLNSENAFRNYGNE
jgi:hypothetical protein